ncbi:MAG: serine--tRNA ligase [Microscillaceae bacterium]|nr:serine--tRNA ligase [Microscillaceae bacterium]
MLELSHIRDSTEQVIAGLEKRGIQNAATMIGEVLDLDQKRRETQLEMDQTRAEAGNVAKRIGQLKKEGKHEEADQAQQNSLSLKEKVKELTQAFQEYELKLKDALYLLPNVPHARVPEGSSSAQNIEVFQHGDMPNLPENALPHWELIQKYDIIDFELGNKVTGAGFPFYKGKGAKLQRALINFFLDEAAQAGYDEVQPPLLVNQDSGLGTGQLPDKEGQMYHATADNFYLIPTAEVPITNIFRDVILKEDDFPIKKVGYTPCFRREAGSWGADVRGLNRLHQFDKVEIVQIQHPDKSYNTLEEMCAHVKSLLEKLELPYRILSLCAGDLGFTSAFTYDFEVYSAAQKKWLEVSSVSNFQTFQSNRLGLRYRDAQNKKYLAHTLNGSALALPRILAALLENNQSPEGIHIPQVLQTYTKFDLIHD